MSGLTDFERQYLPLTSPLTLRVLVERLDKENRDLRQRAVHEWCAAAFGADHASSVEQRAVRFLEESIELYQACDGTAAMAHKLIDYIFARPVGAAEQEFGGVDVTLLALAAAKRLSAEDLGKAEFERIKQKPLEYYSKRNAEKGAAGFDVTGAYPPAMSEMDRDD